MADKLENYPVLDFSGGIRRDLWYKAFQRNELLDARNVELTEKGRVKTRRGSQQLGNTLSASIRNSTLFSFLNAGSVPTINMLTNTNGATAVISRLVGARLTADITTASTTINVNTSGNMEGSTFPASAEIEGDLFTYTGTTGTSLTGVSGLTFSHSSGAAINQWRTLTQSGTACSGIMGIYYAVLNNLLIFTGGISNMKQYDANVVSDISGEPAVLFLTNYRDRIYGAGDASTGTNGDARRISFSNLGDGTTWTTASDFFDVEDQRGEYITGLKVLNDKLAIFKTNSFFTYDEIELKQRNATVGAYNQEVIKEINGLIYTFCPSGIFVTNLTDTKQIGDPVKQYWKNFLPTYDSRGRTITNTFSGKFEDRYFLYIQNITDPTTTSDVVLEYNTTKKNWVVHTGGFTNFTHFFSTDLFKFGDQTRLTMPGLFGGDSGGKYWRFFEKTYIDTQATPVIHKGDIFQDLISDVAVGAPISAVIETPLYDLTHPNLWKTFKKIRVYAEQSAWQVSYRIVNEKGLSEYKPLGEIRTTEKVLKFPPEAVGWRIGLRFTSANTQNIAKFNGFVFEDTEVTNRD